MLSKIILASHGTLAEGVFKAASIILGNKETERVQFLNCYIDEKQDVVKDINEIVESCDNNTVVFTDIFGGSVNNNFYSKMEEKGFLLVSGLNLPMLIEALLFQGDIDEYKEHLKNSASEYIKILELSDSEESVDEEF